MKVLRKINDYAVLLTFGYPQQRGVCLYTPDDKIRIVNAKNMTLSELLSFRDHPIDRFPALIEHKIPVALVCGDADTTVPYKENGELLSKLYRQKGLPLYEVLKPGCDHHPHGLEDNTELIKFIEAYYK